ncbi:hypothetical protein HY641_05135 [Candidatus Woesearchaeota archaeon]|nr:hypothetical protein [Candidatus Woesearchaeota archaeon]
MRSYITLILIVGITASFLMLQSHSTSSNDILLGNGMNGAVGIELSGKFAPQITISKGIPGPKRERTPAPIAANVCNMTTMDERIACRLRTNVSAIEYLPEACRLVATRLQDRCREQYGHTHKCLTLKDVARRSVCMQKQANLQSIKAERISCTLGRVNTTQCMQILRIRVDGLITQSLYMLELRAIEMHQQHGAPSGIVAPMLKTIEEHILTYGALRKTQDKIRILKAAQTDWKKFVAAAQQLAKKPIGPYNANDHLDSRIKTLRELG